MSIIAILRNIISYICLLIMSIICIPPAMAIAFLPAKYRYDNKFFFGIIDLYFKSILFFSFLPKKIIGQENINHNEPLIFIANHQSAFDIPVVGSLLNGYSHIWLVLEYYLRKPILGFFVRRMFVPVDRASSTKATGSLLKLIRLVANHKRHLIIFPEGARYADGKVHKFFEGFAIIAKKTERKVIPVYMPNNYKIYPPKTFFINYYPIIIVIGKPMLIGPEETTEQFTQRVQNWYLEQEQLKENS